MTPAPVGEPQAGMIALGISVMEEASLVVGELLLALLLALEAGEQSES